ncbi:MAG: aminotransferase class V-fold PLP-dependent enzyme, partial [Planctomycetia bacterium]|nr:aminotransferase class V-fold PLP-dependent enzyme [Planctomycetia bacterium]
MPTRIESTTMPAFSSSNLPRRYLDNAATSWPKPESVWRAWEQTARENGAVAGRGGYHEAVAADALLAQARGAFADLLAVPADRIALPASATIGLNQAIHGLLRPGDHAIATAADHNATLRPLHHLACQGKIEFTVVPCDGRGWVDPQTIADAWRPATRLVSLSHASNVTGTVQDAAAVATITRERGGVTLLDASQSLGQGSAA